MLCIWETGTPTALPADGGGQAVATSHHSGLT